MINKKSLESLIFSGALDAFGERASLLASIAKMTAYLKEIEHKNETSQMGLFDMGDAPSAGVDFELEKASPMTFEERMRGERMTIGYPVSGHPLDGMEDFIQKKSKNIAPIFAWLEQQSSRDADADGLITETSSPDVDAPSADMTPLATEESDTPPPLPIPIADNNKEEPIYATLIGLVQEVRSIPTKS